MSLEVRGLIHILLVELWLDTRMLVELLSYIVLSVGFSEP